jgi:TRAP-type C4-dicarboxylate transport system substrate-binding protein
VTTLTTEQRSAFVQATRPVYEKWSKTIGEDLVKKAESAISKR